MRLLAYLLVCLGLCITELGIATSEDAVFIGQQRELFLDSDLIRTANGITLQLHEAEPREVILVTDEPWEGNTCAYYTIFQDGDKYRMYYRGSHWDESKKRATHPRLSAMQKAQMVFTGRNLNWESVNLKVPLPITSFGMESARTTSHHSKIPIHSASQRLDTRRWGVDARYEPATSPPSMDFLHFNLPMVSIGN